MKKIEHLGIAVNNLEESSLLYEKLFGSPAYKLEEVASEGVKTAFFMSGPNKIELLEATNPESPIAKFIAKSVAIKSGKYLNTIELENIVNGLFACKEPNVSPFQKPIFITLTTEDLDKRF